jgi:competence protein ComEC
MEAKVESRPIESLGDSRLPPPGSELPATVASSESSSLDEYRPRETAPPCADHQPRYQPLVIVMIAVSAGIVLDRYGSSGISSDWSGASGIPSIAIVGFWWASAAVTLLVWWKLWRGHSEHMAVWPLLLAAAMSGATWHHLRWSLFGSNEIGRFAGYEAQPACVDAIALETPELMEAPDPTPLRAIPGTKRSRMFVELAAIRDGTKWQDASGFCQLVANGHLSDIHAGSRLRIFGQLRRLHPPLNPGEFDFAAHARADRQFVRLRSSAPDSVIVRPGGSRWTASSMLDAMRTGSKVLVRQFVGSDRAALAAAILLGAREGLQHEETAPYLVTGTIHVLVVSGMNVAILAAGLFGLMRVGWLSRQLSLAIIITAIVSYAVLADAQPPVVRAAVLGILLCIAALAGRRGVAFNSLAAAALIVLAINPADLFRTGPQLSFLSVAVLISIGMLSMSRRDASADRLTEMIEAARPWWRRLLKRIGRWIGWMLLTSLAIWITTLPLILFKAHLISPIGVVVAPVIWILVLVVMWSGFAMLTVGSLAPPLGWLFGVLCNESLGWLDCVVEWAEGVPCGHYWAPGPAAWWVLGFYLGLLAVMLWGRTLGPLRWRVAALAAWIMIGLVPPAVRGMTRDGLTCSFVAVGHGSCVVLETPTGETLLYDAGALSGPEFATQSIASYLWHRGIMRIDGIVISHADIDHYNAVPGLLERFRVGAVYVSPVMFDGFGEAAARGGPKMLQAAISAQNIPIREIWAGDSLPVAPDVTIEVLHPPRNGVIGRDKIMPIV